MKVVGRSGGREDVLSDCATLQRTLIGLRGTGLVSRGVTRFATFEEADAWMKRQIVATHARRSSRTSPPSAGS
jgi:hypothetical protein